MKEITLKNGYVIKVDDEDFENVIRYKWYVAKKGEKDIAVQGSINGIMTYLSRFIMKPEKGSMIGYLDRNPLNNQKSNLQKRTRSQNKRNSFTSKYMGVSKTSNGERFKATIKVNGASIYLGTYKTEEEAARAYNTAVLKYNFDESYLNEID